VSNDRRAAITIRPVGRRVELKRSKASRSRPSVSSVPERSGTVWPSVGLTRTLRLATAGLAALVVFVFYFPGDSTSVEQGHALWFCALALIIGIIAASVSCFGSSDGAFGTLNAGRRPADSADANRDAARFRRIPRVVGVALDIAAWSLAVWVFIAAFATSPPGNLRLATNEAWMWVAGAAVLTTYRRIFGFHQGRQWLASILGVIIVISVGNAVCGLHQEWVSLPADRAKFEADPDGELQKIGLFAPAGSAERMAYQNRLNDGGPIGTFALANSLAGQLLVGLVLFLGMFRRLWAKLSLPHRIAGVGIIILLLACLLETRSRTAITAALLFGGVALIGAGSGEREHETLIARWGARIRGSARWLVVAGALGVLLIGGVLTFGNPEWVDAGPASLAFRFQYWRSTLAMVSERPWFGSGPGNFQSIYERYREASANEQIAEPHNFFYETLAAGGWVAAVCLLTMMGCAAWLMFFGNRGGSRSDASNVHESRLRKRGRTSATDSANSLTRDARTSGDDVWLGALLALVIVWVIALLTLQFPDLVAQAYAIPIAIMAGLYLRSIIRCIPRHASEVASPEKKKPVEEALFDGHAIANIALLAWLTHLLVSGGWTVPGLALIGWILAAIAVGSREPVASEGNLSDGKDINCSRPHGAASGQDGVSREGASWGPVWMCMVLVVGLGLLLMIRFLSIGPVGNAEALVSRAGYAMAEGQIGAAKQNLDAAFEADEWSAEVALARADAYRWSLVRASFSQDETKEFGGAAPSGDRMRSLHRDWLRAAEETLQRAGQSPAMLRALVQQTLHVYQRFGNPDDLELASQWLAESTQWSPSHQWHWAQRAAVADAQGDAQTASEFARRAFELSRLGSNYQRWLERQLILPAEFIGAEVRGEPRLRPASDVLKNLLADPGVTPTADPDPLNL
ncbi:MAG: O-antigen ligase family protein, partial [Planctomycetota bacterium]